MSRTRLIAAVLAVSGITAHAQPPADAARLLVAAARAATATLATPDDARRAGFVPVFGNAPLQGAHFARPDLVMRDSFDVTKPSVVMYAQVDGKETLAGVAYTYYLPNGLMQPRGWPGPAEVWHSHEELARIPGQHIVMMHVWLIASPDGPLAHYNPALPYLAAGLTFPEGSASTDHAAQQQARLIGLGIDAATLPPDVLDEIQRQAAPELGRQITERRAKLAALIPGLRTTDNAGATQSGSAHREFATAVDSLLEAYRAAADSSPRLTKALDIVASMYLGNAHHHP